MKLPVYSDGCQSGELVKPGAYMTKEQAQRYGNKNIPPHLKRLGYVAYVFTSCPIIHGASYYRITYGREC